MSEESPMWSLYNKYIGFRHECLNRKQFMCVKPTDKSAGSKRDDLTFVMYSNL